MYPVAPATTLTLLALAAELVDMRSDKAWTEDKDVVQLNARQQHKAQTTIRGGDCCCSLDAVILAAQIRINQYSSSSS